VAGAITGIFCKPGQYVKKGQALCSISSKEIISMQQDFAETSNRLHALRIDYERAKSLYAEKVGSQKELLSLESEYKSTQARYEGLRTQLQLMNINAKVTESGAINPSYPVCAPISGYISMQNAILGKYSEPGELLFEIIDLNQMHLQLSVFEKDISKLRIGQPVNFIIQGRPDTTFQASISSIGKSIDPESGSIKCIASLNGNDSRTLVHGMFADANIATTEKKALALPTGAISKSGEESFVFIVEKTGSSVYYLKPQKVETGLETKGYTEVLGIDSLKQILIKGVYNLPVEM
jgi:cobalt-zinc-cadmium efflux system membrane fusion protein